ncbi:MAG: hypothetical protein NTY80_02380 [candidate division SR1 bacterium]|nr:hypothetical protein [candidate division SR1 bacterium]
MKKKIIVNDKMQKNYIYYLTQPMGKNFSPIFHPQLTPQEMLEMGVFGGKYMTDCQNEFPSSWFKNAKLSSQRKDPKLNFFKVNASLPLSFRHGKGWMYEDDPRGWFQRYCRYYMGRRCADDERQIKRRKAMMRHVKAIRNNCYPLDRECRKRQRQAVLHRAYDSRKI